jgi:hypothetical protein
MKRLIKLTKNQLSVLQVLKLQRDNLNNSISIVLRNESDLILSALESAGIKTEDVVVASMTSEGVEYELKTKK